MTEKLDNLSNDILALLRNIEPNRLRNYEIVESLWKSYQSQYKDKKSFGVAVTQKLTLLKAKRLIIHEDIWYGTLNSKIHGEKPAEEFKQKLVIPNPYLSEKERKLYRLDADLLAAIKEMCEPESDVDKSEWQEWYRREAENFQRRWGLKT